MSAYPRKRRCPPRLTKLWRPRHPLARAETLGCEVSEFFGGAGCPNFGHGKRCFLAPAHGRFPERSEGIVRVKKGRAVSRRLTKLGASSIPWPLLGLGRERIFPIAVAKLGRRHRRPPHLSKEACSWTRRTKNSRSRGALRS